MSDPLWINADAGTPAYSAGELRQAMALALAYDGRNLGGRQGVRPGGNQLQVSLAVSTITVQPGVACVDPGLSTPQGPYWVATPLAETHTLTPADATNPRKDIVILRVYDNDEDASGLRLARTEYLVGAPSPSPAEPAVPAGAIRLATIDVPAVGGGSAVVTDRRPWTVGAGGILPVRAAGDIAAGVAGRWRDRLDTGVLERDSGTVWETAADPAVFRAWTAYAPTWTTTGTQPALGSGSLTGRWARVGQTVHATGRIQLAADSSVGTGDWRMSVPAAAQAGSLHVGTAMCYDSSDIPGSRPAAVWMFDVNTLRFTSPSGEVASTTPFAWATSDQMRWSITYEAAA